MGLFDFIQRNRNLKEQMPNIDEKPQIEVFQYDDNGNVDYTKTLNARQNSTPRSLKEHLFGRTMSIDEQTINPETKEAELVTHTNFKPGFMNNLDQGLNENFYNNFSINNLMPNKNKGLATRFGEGLGSVAKILATVGGDAYTAGTQGLDAALKRQNYRTENQLYRNALERQGIDTSNINGLINGDMFKNYTLANYRNRNLDQTSYIKMTKQLEQLHKTGQISNDAYMAALSDLNTQYVNSNTFNINNVKDSNETILTPVKASAIASNAVANTKRANAYSDWMTNKTHNNEAENADLAEFLEILNANDNGKTEYARNAFIKKYGKDPYKLIKM
jgi:hypothetical protein